MQTALLSWPPKERGDVRFLARPFAAACADLNIDFAAAPRIALVTDLLSLCLQRPSGDPLSADYAWGWSVAERLQGLLAIAHASNGPMAHAMATCSHRDCAGQIEMDLGLDAFASAELTMLEWCSPEGKHVRLRLPNGRDLAAWQTRLESDATDAEAWLANLLIESIDGDAPTDNQQLPMHWLAPLAAALDRADPLTALTLQLPCPFCDRIVQVEVDLELLLLDGLRSRQARLTDEIHQLAAHYHWSEAEIVALPAWRRQRYIARLRAELA